MCLTFLRSNPLFGVQSNNLRHQTAPQCFMLNITCVILNDAPAISLLQFFMSSVY